MPRRRTRDERITFRLTSDVRRKLDKEAEVQQRPVSWLVETYIKAGLGIAMPPPPTSYPGNGNSTPTSS